MESPGEYLSREREIRGISLKQISEKTKIGIEYLRCIEEGRFERIPGEVFLKGFLRSYAQALGIDEKEVMDRYNQFTSEGLDKKKDQEIEEVVKKRPYLQKRFLCIAIAGILMFTTVLFVGIHRKRGVLRYPPQETIATELSPLLAKTSSPSPKPKEVNLLIEAIEETWIKVLIDRRETREALLRKGDKIKLTAEKDFDLTIGNAGGIKLTFNGKEIGPLGQSGKVIRNLILSKD